MELDSLLNLDVYRTRKEDLVILLQRFNIKIFHIEDTQVELRQLASLLKKIVGFVNEKPVLKSSVELFLNNRNTISDEILENFSDIKELVKLVKQRDNKFVAITEGRIYYTPPTEDERLDVDGYQQPINSQVNKDSKSHVYEDIDNVLNGIERVAIPSLISRQNNFSTSGNISQEIIMEQNSGEEKRPLINAIPFSGLPSENVNDFMDRFELAIRGNNWKLNSILGYFPTYLYGNASNWYKHFMAKEKNPTWEQIRTECKKAFTPIAQSDTLQLIMERRIQGTDETPLNFMFDVIVTCRRYESQIDDRRIIRYVIQGLKPDICSFICTMANDSLDELEENIRRAEAYLLATNRNRDKYRIETTRYNTEANSKIESIEEKYKSQLESKLEGEIKELKSLVANLQMNTRRERSRDRNQSEYRGMSRSRSPKGMEKQRTQPMGSDVGRYGRMQQPSEPRQANSYQQRRFNAVNMQHRDVGQIRFNGNGGTRLQMVFCHICNKNNHATKDCRYNGLNNPRNSQSRFSQGFQLRGGNTGNNLCWKCNGRNHKAFECKVSNGDLKYSKNF